MRKIEGPVRITVLMDNKGGEPGVHAEHGLSIWLEFGHHAVLFDAGQSGHTMDNAMALGIDAGRAEAIALSHGHYDHTGGLSRILPATPQARVYLHPMAFGPRYSRKDDGTLRETGMPGEVAGLIRTTHRVVSTMGPTEIVDGLFVSGRIPRGNNFEGAGGHFFMDPDCTCPDPLHDDQAMYFRSSRGLVIVLGCAHAGVINTIDHIRAISGGWSVRAVLGGMHLKAASLERLDATVEALREHNIGLLAPSHCTGDAAFERFQREFPDRVIDCHVGSRFAFE